jgi:hypothetical protein
MHENRKPHSQPSGPGPDTLADQVGTRPLGAVVGAAGGAAAGAMGGMAAGPVGSLAGAMVGAVLVGNTGAGEAGLGPSVRGTVHDARGAGASPQRPGDRAATGSAIHPGTPARPEVDNHGNPAVRYGAQAYAHYRGAVDWGDVEDELAAGWETARGTSSQRWEDAAPLAHAAWLRSRDVARHTLSGDSPDQGLQYRAPVEEDTSH